MVRHHDIDTVRGTALVSMIAYHTCWDFVYLLDCNWGWYRSFGAYVWQQSICWSFILLSGYCFFLGRRPARRGLVTFAAGALVSAVTYVILPEDPIFCGVLTFLGLAAILSVPLKPLLRRIQPQLGLGACFLLFMLFRDVNEGFLGFEGARVAALPQGTSLLTTVLGFPPADFHSSDYFSLLPWLFLFWTGVFLSRLRPERDDLILRPIPVITAMGRHSLLIYLAHQPVLYALLPLFEKLIGAFA